MSRTPRRFASIARCFACCSRRASTTRSPTSMLAVFVELDADARARGARCAALARARRRAAWPCCDSRFASDARAERIRAHHATTRLEENMFDSLVQDLALRRSLAAPRAGLRARRRAHARARHRREHGDLQRRRTACCSRRSPCAIPSRLVARERGRRTAAPTASNTASTSPAASSTGRRARKTMRIAGYRRDVRRRSHRPAASRSSSTGTSSVGGLMDVLGVQPLLGRTLTVADEDPGGASGRSCSATTPWQRLFGDDPAVARQDAHARTARRARSSA